MVGRAIVPLLMGDDPDSGSVLPLSTFDELCAGRLLAEIDEEVGVMVLLTATIATPPRSSTTRLAEEHWAVAIGPVPSSVSMLGDVRQVPIVLEYAAISLLGLMAGTHTMMLAVRRRGGDLAALRAIGMRPVDVRRVVGWQAIAMGAVSVAVGVPLGLVLGRVAWTAISRPANVLVHVVVDPLVVAGVALVVGRAAARRRHLARPSRRPSPPERSAAERVTGTAWISAHRTADGPLTLRAGQTRTTHSAGTGCGCHHPDRRWQQPCREAIPRVH